MEYNNIQQIDKQILNIRKKIQKYEKSTLPFMEKIVEEKRKNFMKKKEKQILSVFKITCYSNFQEVFFENYGKNFNPQLLNLSLSFSINKDLIPSISYNVVNFDSLEQIYQARKNFNKNLSEQEFSKIMRASEIHIAENIEYYDTSLLSLSPYLWAINGEKGEENKIYSKNRQPITATQIYKLAELKSLEAFYPQYQHIWQKDITK